MKVTMLVVALFLPVLAFAQQRPPPDRGFEWADGVAFKRLIQNGWNVGTANGKCSAIDPQKKHHEFPRRADGKCHAEDAK